LNSISIYIGGVELDLFQDEDVQIVDSIQNARDIAKVFTTYSRTFSVPASSINNKVFGHYYNLNVLSDFDARIKVGAELKLNGFTFKEGKVSLVDVKLKSNNPSSYTLVFYGNTVELTDLFGDLELGALGVINKYNHAYTLVNAKDGLQTGLVIGGGGTVIAGTGRSLIYPLITHTKRYIYDSAANVLGNQFFDTTDGLKLDYRQLKPAIKMIHIIEAIEAQFGITFTRDFFGLAYFNELYMWLHKNKGGITSEGRQNTFINFNEFTRTSGSATFSETGGVPFTAVRQFGGRSGAYGLLTEEHTLTFGVTIFGSGNYDFKLRNYFTGELVYESNNNSGTQSFVVEFPRPSPDLDAILTTFTHEIVSDGTITSIDVSITNEKITYNDWQAEIASRIITSGLYDTPAISPINEVIIADNLPKMKIIDFLTNIFKMFNLTAYKKSDGNIYVDTLDNFYAGGTTRDITRFIDVSESVIAPSSLFKEIEFKYSQARTILASERNERVGEEFGSVKYSGNNNLNNSKYTVQVGFDHLMFERLINQDTGNNTNMLTGYFVDKDENPIEAKGLVFFISGLLGPSGVDIEWEGTTNSTTYLRASNSNTAGTETLNFNAEIDEYLLTTVYGSLFERYYKSYIESIYNYRARIISMTAYLPLSFLLAYTLDDVLLIDGKGYRINSMSANLKTGKTDLELINIV
jgi:hypothetical protein